MKGASPVVPARMINPAGSFRRRTVLLVIADVGEVTAERCGGGHARAHQMRTSTTALPTFEIAVRCGGAAFARLQLVGIHRQAHGAARLAPFETRLAEDAVE